MKLLTVLTTPIFVLKVCVLVQGLYLVQVKLNGYSNPTGKCGDNQHCHTSSGQRCCDSFTTTNCRQFCDSYFIYCLRPLGERRPVGSPRCFSNETRAESSPNRDDRSLDLSRSRVLNLDNPQNLSGLGDAYQGVQIYIEVQDDDGNINEDDLIDLLLIDHNLMIARSLQQNHTGIYNFVTMNLTITVFCEENFGGSDCTQCVPGFTGTNCDEKDHCFRVNCSSNGKCTNTFSNESITLFTCVCDSGYKGESCELIDCSLNSCSRNGACVDDSNSPSCNCSTGFTGRECEINIDDCSSNPCDERGQCVDGVNNFTCDCTPGFTGPLCNEVDRSNVGAIAGGVVGSLLAIVILLILIVVIVVIILKCRSNDVSNQDVCDEDTKETHFKMENNIVYGRPDLEMTKNEAYTCFIRATRES